MIIAPNKDNNTVEYFDQCITTCNPLSISFKFLAGIMVQFKQVMIAKMGPSQSHISTSIFRCADEIALSLASEITKSHNSSQLRSYTNYHNRYQVMRSHYLWLQKSQNCTIPVNLEAIWTTMIASKLFQPLYLGYSQVLHYIIYGLQLSNVDISLASSDLSASFKYNLKKLNYLWSL